MSKDMSPRPLVSVILATFNEAHSIEKCLHSLLSQETSGFDLEILAIDGNSSDGTREILDEIAAVDSRVRVLVNEKRKAPFAFNLGLREARGNYVCIFGAHTIYAQDYISVCLKELIAQGAGACGGRVVTAPRDNSLEAHLVAWTLSHPFGSSRKSFRTQPEGFVDTVNYPVALKKALVEVGGYDEELTRNQDNDTNQKLRARGYGMYCTWKTHCLYYPKGVIKDLFRYGFGNGFWNVISLEKNFESMGARHFIPFLFVLGLIATSVMAIAGIFLPAPYGLIAAGPFLALLGLHLGVGAIAAGQVALRERSSKPLCLPGVFLGFHLAYGYGTLCGLLRRGKALADLPRLWLASKRQLAVQPETFSPWLGAPPRELRLAQQEVGPHRFVSPGFKPPQGDEQ